MLDPVDDMGIKDEGLKSIVRVLYSAILTLHDMLGLFFRLHFPKHLCKWR